MTFRIEDLVGLELFSDTFKEYRDEYVIIGGLSTAYAVQRAGLEPRVTQDIDLVVYANPNVSFANRLSRFVTSGGYETAEKGTYEKTNSYRFLEPSDSLYPKQIEIFSSSPFAVELTEGQHIVPMPTDAEYKSLSAILIDSEYVELARENRIFFGNMPFLNPVALICLKIAAYFDLTKRKQQGESIDSRDIKKHRNDVFVLTVILDNQQVELPAGIRDRIKEFSELPELRSFNAAQLNQILSSRGIRGQNITGILDKLISCFCSGR